MSANLSPKIAEEFTNAVDAEKFFDATDLKKIRNHEKREQAMPGSPHRSCVTNLFFGFFFDGTKNNYILAEKAKNHSNVARLYDCYPGLSVPSVLPKDTDWQYNVSRHSHFFKVYVPGVASPFPHVGDSGEGLQQTRGAACGAIGEQRIIWALVQAINNIHRYLLKTPLVAQDEMGGLLRKIILNSSSRSHMDRLEPLGKFVSSEDIYLVTRKMFERLLSRLHSAVSTHWPDSKTGKAAKPILPL
jgi:hypothetical protein